MCYGRLGAYLLQFSVKESVKLTRLGRQLDRFVNCRAGEGDC
jgi:hypothetical protein